MASASRRGKTLTSIETSRQAGLVEASPTASTAAAAKKISPRARGTPIESRALPQIGHNPPRALARRLHSKQSPEKSGFASKSTRTRRTLADPFAHSSTPPEGERARQRAHRRRAVPDAPTSRTEETQHTSLRPPRRRSRVRRASTPKLVLLRLLFPNDLLARGLERRLEVDGPPSLFQLLEVRPDCF